MTNGCRWKLFWELWGLGLGSTGGNRKLQQPPSQLSTAQHGSAAQRGARDLPCWILTMVPDTARTQHNRTHNNTTAVSSTTAPPPSCAYIPVYLQISTLHLVNTYSVRRYLHCTVRPTSSSSTKYAVVSMETEESLTSGLQYAPGRGLGAAQPRT